MYFLFFFFWNKKLWRAGNNNNNTPAKKKNKTGKAQQRKDEGLFPFWVVFCRPNFFWIHTRIYFWEQVLIAGVVRTPAPPNPVCKLFGCYELQVCVGRVKIPFQLLNFSHDLHGPHSFLGKCFTWAENVTATQRKLTHNKSQFIYDLFFFTSHHHNSLSSVEEDLEQSPQLS